MDAPVWPLIGMTEYYVRNISRFKISLGKNWEIFTKKFFNKTKWFITLLVEEEIQEFINLG